MDQRRIRLIFSLMAIVLVIGAIYFVTYFYVIHDDWNINFLASHFVTRYGSFGLLLCLTTIMIGIYFTLEPGYSKLLSLWLVVLIPFAGAIWQGSQVVEHVNDQFRQHEIVKTVTSDHFTQIDGRTFIVNGKKYQVESGDQVKTTYASMPLKKREIKVSWREPGKMPKALRQLGFDEDLPTDSNNVMIATPKNNDTLRVTIRK